MTLNEFIDGVKIYEKVAVYTSGTIDGAPAFICDADILRDVAMGEWESDLNLLNVEVLSVCGMFDGSEYVGEGECVMALELDWEGDEI